MTVQYAIVAFPAFDTPEPIEALRRRFDPVSGMLAAHVTLVFPFEDSAGLSALQEHVTNAASGTSPFAIELAEPTVEDEYLFLRVAEGTWRLVALHDRLYAGALSHHRSRAHTYRPHVTVGRLGSSEQQAAAVAEARLTLSPPGRGRIDSLAIFRLNDGSTGFVECTIPLGASTSAR